MHLREGEEPYMTELAQFHDWEREAVFRFINDLCKKEFDSMELEIASETETGIHLKEKNAESNDSSLLLVNFPVDSTDEEEAI
ncbi:MAG: hypothetical protein ACI35P_06375 [Bacillus sp. (in: firmicutes)]